MQPQIWGLPPFPIVLGLAIALGTGIHLALARHEGYPLGPLLWFQVAIISVALVGAKGYSLLVDPGASLARGTFSGNFRYPGALIATVAVAPLLRRILPAGLTLRGLGDLLAPSAGFSLAVIRIDCLLEGCCSGKLCELPWAIRFPPGSPVWFRQIAEGQIEPGAAASLPVHPLQIYFLVAAMVAGLVCLHWIPRKRYDGQVLLIFLALHESSKFLLELLRQPAIPALRYTSLAVGLVATALLLALWVRGQGQREEVPA